MTDQEIQLFLDDFANGAPAPTVDPADIRQMWEFLERTRNQAHDAPVQGLVSFPIAPEGLCGPGANLGAVWVRASLVEMLQRHGLLKQWERDTSFEDRVFAIAAVYPMRVGNFDPEDFVRRLAEE